MNWSDYSRFVGDIFGARSPSRACSPSSSSRPSSACGSSAGTASPSAAPGDHLGRRHRHPAVRLFHPRRQLVHAEPGGLPAERGDGPPSSPTSGRCSPTRCCSSGSRTRSACFLTAGALARRRHVAADPPAGRRHRRLPQPPASAPPSLVRPRRALSGPRAGPGHDRRPADEDGRGRGAVRDPQPAGFDLHDRHARRQRRGVLAGSPAC